MFKSSIRTSLFLFFSLHGLIYYFPLSLSLNITEIEVQPRIAIAPDKVSLKCLKQEDNENDTFISLSWFKFINESWTLISRHPTETDRNEEILKLEDLDPTESVEGNVVFGKSSLSTAGFYKCSVNSSRELVDRHIEIRVIYKPEENSKPTILYHSIGSLFITVGCSAPASYPSSAILFFINNELAANSEVSALKPVMVKNSSYGDGVELAMNVAELKIMPIRRYVLNNRLEIVCAATQSQHYHQFADPLIVDYFGDIIEMKTCISGALIALIVIAIILILVIVIAIVWFAIRKKNSNKLNKVAELFVNNKGANLVD